MANITTGRTVLYVISEQDARQINKNREAASQGEVFPSVQKHVGNYHSAGDVVPLIVVRVWPDEFGPGVPGVNGQAILDGNDSLWVTSAKEGTEPGTWHWPTLVPFATQAAAEPEVTLAATA